jgi:hypothetical protein
MMTGRDLVLYILQNRLEDEPVFEDGIFLGFMNEMEAAVKFNVGTSTIRAWVYREMLPAIRIGSVLYIPANAEKPDMNNGGELEK